MGLVSVESYCPLVAEFHQFAYSGELSMNGNCMGYL